MGGFLGLLRSGIGSAIGGLLSGLTMGAIAGFGAGVAGKFLSDTFRIMPYHKGLEAFGRTLFFQSTAFLIVGLAMFATFLLCGPTLKGRTFRVLSAALVAAVLSSPLYLAGASLVAPLASTDNFVPLDSHCRLVWFVAPALLISLAMGWLAIVPKGIEPAPVGESNS